MKETKIGTARTLLAETPNLNAKQLAEKMGISEQYAYGMLWKLKQPIKKKARKPRRVSRIDNGIKQKKITADMLRDLSYDLSQGRKNWRMVQVATSNKPIHDAVNHPAHYKVGGIETIDFIEAKKLSYNLGNVVKYITRANHKGNRKEDLEKARWYLNRELSSMEK